MPTGLTEILRPQLMVSITGSNPVLTTNKIEKMERNPIKGVFLFDGNIKTEEIRLFLENEVDWDKSMKSRWTASYGRAYNYSGQEYPYREMPKVISEIASLLSSIYRIKINNCLINLYHDGKSKMGWHSDNTDILEEETCVVILSVGETREIQFKHKTRDDKVSLPLEDGSIFYMNNHIQNEWLHSIPENDSTNPRWSLTFRQIK
jgi:alkylated DNA repair dioxygenase AlkB